MKISVATVCYNSQDTIENTIRSVIAQTWSDVEYIIVDGASSDNTLDILKSYADEYGIRVISEPDKGLYDAMNKAADMASGDYIIYMNSGDAFAADDVIEKMIPFLEQNRAIVYGNVIRIKPKGEITERYAGKHKLIMLLLAGRMMSHQSVFIRSDIMRSYRYDLNYSITADYDFIVRAKHSGLDMLYVDTNISKVENIEGISSLKENMDEMRRQDDLSLRKNYPILFCIVWLPKAIVRAINRYYEKR